MLLMAVFFVCLAFFVRFCGQNKLEYDYQKFVLDKHKEEIYLFSQLLEGFSDKDIEDLIDLMKKYPIKED